MILFLDYDGVLHPEDVYLMNGRPTLKDGGELFQWAPILADTLAPFAEVKIILSTSWVRVRGFNRSKRALPFEIAKRVIGATWRTEFRHTGFEDTTRYNQIAGHAIRARLPYWIAIDDDGEGWPETARDRLVRTNGRLGLSDSGVVRDLQEKLRRLTAGEY